MPHCWKSHVTAHKFCTTKLGYSTTQIVNNRGAHQTVRMYRLMFPFVVHMHNARVSHGSHETVQNIRFLIKKKLRIFRGCNLLSYLFAPRHATVFFYTDMQYQKSIHIQCCSLFINISSKRFQAEQQRELVNYVFIWISTHVSDEIKKERKNDKGFWNKGFI